MEIVPVETGKQKKLFIDFPHDLYAGDVNYVPELFVAQRDLLDPKKNPFFEHADIQLYLAMDGHKVKGRVAAIRNDNHNEYTGEKTGFFGFFEVVDDYSIAEALLNKVINWLKTHGFNKVVGPVNPSTNDTCGVLVEGDDRPPVVMMTYNPSYYLEFLERYGFRKQMDILAYEIITANVTNDRAFNKLGLLEERLGKKGIFIRPIDMKNFKQEVSTIKKVYNAAWDKNWGFVPATDKEFDHVAADMKMIMDPRLCFVAIHEDKVIGFSLAIPDINQAFRKVKRGRLLPLGIFKLLWHKRKIDFIRVITLGVLEEYRKLGVEACFYGRIMRHCIDHHIRGAEASWILETNDPMNRALVNMTGRMYKRYRLYQQPIS